MAGWLAASPSLRQDELGETKRVPRAGPQYLQNLVSKTAAKAAQADLHGEINYFFEKKKKKEESVCVWRNP